jgi:hypothetical protein
MEVTPESITVLRPRNERLAKQVLLDGSMPSYSTGLLFDLLPKQVSHLGDLGDLGDLEVFLHSLIERPGCAVIQWAPIDPTCYDNVRRLRYQDRDTGYPPTVRGAAGLAAHRMVQQHGLGWRDVVEPPAIEKALPQLGIWRQTVARCLESPRALGPREICFARDLPEFRRLSTIQRYVLEEIASRVLAREGVH